MNKQLLRIVLEDCIEDVVNHVGNLEDENGRLTQMVLELEQENAKLKEHIEFLNDLEVVNRGWDV